MASLSKPESKPLWARDLSPIGLNYFGGVVDNAEEILEKYKLGSAMKKIEISKTNGVPNQYTEYLNLILKTAKRAAPTLRFSRKKLK